MSGMNPPTENVLWYGDWRLSGKAPNRLLTRYEMNDIADTADAVERISEGHETFGKVLDSLTKLWDPRNFHHSVPGSKHVKPEPEPVVEKTVTEVKEVHFVRKEGAPLDSPSNVVYGPIDTANDAQIIAMIINEKFDLDEGEVYEAVTRKTTVETTIL